MKFVDKSLKKKLKIYSKVFTEFIKSRPYEIIDFSIQMFQCFTICTITKSHTQGISKVF